MATLINGDGNAAVYAAQDADWFAGVEGNATKRLNIGLKMAYEIEDANTIAVKDGVIVTKEGRRIQIDAGAIDEFIIPTGTQGVTRYFIIGYHLYTDGSSNQLCETFVQLMANGTDTISEDTFRGGSTEVYVSLYRVTQNGLALDTIQSLLPERTTIDAVKSEIDTANKMDNIVDCSTARNVSAKTVSLSGFSLKTNAKVIVRFTNTGSSNPSSGNITLNVNNTGAKNIIDGHTNNQTMTYSNGSYFYNNQVCEFIYNGTAWVWLNRDTNTTYNGGSLKTAAAKTGSGSTVTNTIAANTTMDNAIGTLLNNDYKMNSDIAQINSDLTELNTVVDVSDQFEGATSITAKRIGNVVMVIANKQLISAGYIATFKDNATIKPLFDISCHANYTSGGRQLAINGVVSSVGLYAVLPTQITADCHISAVYLTSNES